MRVNADFTQRAVVHFADTPWITSPVSGIRRKMYDRVGHEVARATTLVEYAPGSQFPAHTHTGGEEFVVLEGVFQDEHGDFPAGSYVRNPPESSHFPGSEKGCLIFVKLWQFDLNDREHLRLNINQPVPETVLRRDGMSTIPIYSDSRETVRIEVWEPGMQVLMDAPGGAELLVLDGSFTEGEDNFRYLSWLRSPVGGTINAVSGPNGARVWIKTDHLNSIILPR